MRKKPKRKTEMARENCWEMLNNMGITEEEEEEEEEEKNEVRRQFRKYKLDCQMTHIKVKTLKSEREGENEGFFNSVTNDTIIFASRQI